MAMSKSTIRQRWLPLAAPLASRSNAAVIDFVRRLMKVS